MNLAELQKRVADVLGVSVSQKELAFEIFSEKVSETLDEGITLKVPRIGYFQLKSISQDDNGAHQLIFSPLQEDFSKESKALYLTIDLILKTKDSFEFDSTVFSIGVGKPLIPLEEKNLSHDSETSFAMLKKSIEERVKELITESDRIPNFSIWDDYYNRSEEKEKMHTNETQSQLTELTQDLDFGAQTFQTERPAQIRTDSDELQSESEEKIEEKIVEPSLDEPLIDNLKTEEPEETIEEKPVETSSDENITRLTISELLDEPTTNYFDKDNVETVLTEIEAAEDENPIDKLYGDLTSGTENLEEQSTVKFDEDEFAEKVLQSEETKNTFGDEETDEEKQVPLEVSDTLELTGAAQTNSDVLNKLLEEDHTKEERIDWNWGDELKEEFGVGSPDEENIDAIQNEKFFEERDLYEEEDLGEEKAESSKKKEDEFFHTKKPKKDLFAELEKTLKSEITSAQDESTADYAVEDESKYDFKDEKVILEFKTPPPKYEFIQKKEVPKPKRMTILLSPEDKQQPLTQDELYEENTVEQISEKEKYFGKTFFIIFTAFVVVTSLIVYMIFIRGTKEQQSSIPTADNSKVALDSSEAYSATSSERKDSFDFGLDELSDFPITATPPVPIKKDKTVNEVPSELQKNNKINPQEKKTIQQQQPRPETKSTSQKLENSELYRTLTTDTKVDKLIFYDGKNFNFQVSSWRDRIKAEQEVKRLRSLGFNAFVAEAFLPQKGGTWFRIRIGFFKSKEEAQGYMRQHSF